MPIARVIAEQDQFDSLLDPFGKELLSHYDLGRIDAPMERGGAMEFAVDASDQSGMIAACRKFFRDADVLVAAAPIAAPDLFVSDMDSTMIGQECIDELADYAGIKPQIAEITERAMQGELDFESALRERVRLLAGLDEGAIRQCLDERIRPMPGARELVATLSALGCRTVLVTGGFHHFAAPVAAQLGFDHVVANRLEVIGGKLTGKLIGEIVDSSVKRATLERELAAMGEVARSLATGDGANDVPMLVAADYGVAYRAKPAAKFAANGWVAQGDLTSVLRLLGIPDSDWGAA